MKYLTDSKEEKCYQETKMRRNKEDGRNKEGKGKKEGSLPIKWKLDIIG